jgi:hypothetical protein
VAVPTNPRAITPPHVPSSSLYSHVFSTPLSTPLLLLLLTASSSYPAFSSAGCDRRAFSCLASASASVFVARKSSFEVFARRGFCEGRTAEDDDDEEEEEVEVTRILGNTEEDEGDNNNNNVAEEDLRRNFVVNSVFFVLSLTRR